MSLLEKDLKLVNIQSLKFRGRILAKTLKSKSSTPVLRICLATDLSLSPSAYGRNIFLSAACTFLSSWCSLTHSTSFCPYLPWLPMAEVTLTQLPNPMVPSSSFVLRIHLKFLNSLWFSDFTLSWSLSSVLAAFPQAPLIDWLPMFSEFRCWRFFLLHFLGPPHLHLLPWHVCSDNSLCDPYHSWVWLSSFPDEGHEAKKTNLRKLHDEY